jgi:hypothetical protein
VKYRRMGKKVPLVEGIWGRQVGRVDNGDRFLPQLIDIICMITDSLMNILYPASTKATKSAAKTNVFRRWTLT